MQLGRVRVIRSEAVVENHSCHWGSGNSHGSYDFRKPLKMAFVARQDKTSAFVLVKSLYCIVELGPTGFDLP